MEEKRNELEDTLKIEQILIEEEIRRELFIKEYFEKGEAA